MKYRCSECQTCYSSIYNLRKHARKFHSNELATELAPLRNKKSSSESDIRCRICDKTFVHQKTLRKHLRVHGFDVNVNLNLQSQSKTVKHVKKCPLCECKNSRKSDLINHYENFHEIAMQWHDLTFPSMDDFIQWKTEIEDKDSSKFVKNRTRISKSCKSILYECHRSGNYLPEGKALRQLKTKGSNKINAYCPASIQVFIENGRLTVKYLETHVGHELDINYLQLTEIERKDIAAKIAANIPFDTILDEIRDSVTANSLKRRHLVTKKDLFNIKSSFNLRSPSVLYSNGTFGVKSWVQKMQSVGKQILFYKASGCVLQEHPHLKQQDFVLILMTPAQITMLQKFGSDCVCLDGITEPNRYGLRLHTVLVVDDLREAFPCAFLFANRSDTDVIKLFLNQIVAQVGVITPKTFISDPNEIYFNAWVEVMSTPEIRLFCMWHIDMTWQKMLAKIENPEKRVFMRTQLRTLSQERDPIVFEKILEQFCDSFDDETLHFINNFKDDYQGNSKHWASCYRLHLTPNINICLEQMHKSTERIFLSKNNVQRFEKDVSALMRFVRDKLIDRLIVLSKGNISCGLKTIHDRGGKFHQTDSSVILHTEHGWEIHSTITSKIYLIQEGNGSCKCQLRCPACDICIHTYYCTCQDSSIDFNICKHIHLFVEFRRKSEKSNEDVGDEISPEEEPLTNLDENDECNTTIPQASKKQKTLSTLEEQKKGLLKQFNAVLDSCTTFDELDVISNVVNSIPDVLAVLNNNKRKHKS